MNTNSGDAASEHEMELVCGYRVHPVAAAFPRAEGPELQALADDIKKHGQIHEITQHEDGSILDGVSRLRACELVDCKPRIKRWDGHPGEELAYVISQNVKRRHLNESQRAIIASELAALPNGQRQVGKFAGVPTQAEAAEMMQVSERSVRTARKVREEAPANLIRLVKAGRISLNAVESISPEDKQRIGAMSELAAEADIRGLNKQGANRSKRTNQREADIQAENPQFATAPRVTAASANTVNDDGDGNRFIGAEAVARALRRTKIESITPEHQALLKAIERLPLNDAGWICELASYVREEACAMQAATL